MSLDTAVLIVLAVAAWGFFCLIVLGLCAAAARWDRPEEFEPRGRERLP